MAKLIQVEDGPMEGAEFPPIGDPGFMGTHVWIGDDEFQIVDCRVDMLYSPGPPSPPATVELRLQRVIRW